jgi:hypothetical protein
MGSAAGCGGPSMTRARCSTSWCNAAGALAPRSRRGAGRGLEESGGVRALVMELVEGEDLAQRPVRGPILLDEWRCHRRMVSGVTIVATWLNSRRPNRCPRLANRRRSTSVRHRRRPRSRRSGNPSMKKPTLTWNKNMSLVFSLALTFGFRGPNHGSGTRSQSTHSAVPEPERGVYIGSLDTKKTKLLLNSEFEATYAPPGYLLFVREETLMAQPFDMKRLELTGERSLVAQGRGWRGDMATASFPQAPTVRWPTSMPRSRIHS